MMYDSLCNATKNEEITPAEEKRNFVMFSVFATMTKKFFDSLISGFACVAKQK